MFNQYQPNLDTLQQYMAAESEKSFGDGPNWWSIPSGMSSVRLLPPWDPTGRVALPVFMHPIEFKSKDMSYTKYNWTCVNKTLGKPCAICEGLAKLAEAGVDVSAWEPNRRQFYFNAIVMHDPTYDPVKKTGVAPGTHVLMKSPKTFYDWVISQITNPMIGDITNVQNGIDILITKEGAGLGTTYNMTTSPNGRTAVPQEYLDKITELYNLDEIFGTGFDQASIDELIAHLGQSAQTIAGAVGNTITQMSTPTMPTYPQGGLNYGQPTVPPQAAVAPQQTVPAPAFSMNPPIPPQAPTAPVQAPTQPIPQAPTNSPTPQVTQPVQPAQNSNKPKCYGNYDAGNVSCVVCPEEINCSQMKK